VDLEITPEPSEEERQAILEALRLEAETELEPTPWRRIGLAPEGVYATAPPRHSLGATRA
jgi:hypothetical protein